MDTTIDDIDITLFAKHSGSISGMKLTPPHRGNGPLLGVEITAQPDTATFNVCETSNPGV